MKRIILLSFIILLSLSTPLAGLAQEPSSTLDLACNEDLTGETLRFYHFGDISGPYAPLTLPVLEGFDDAIAFYNEAGGFCGATIESVVRDTGAQQEAAQAAWDEFSAQDDARIIFMYLTEDAELLRNQAAEAQIPVVVSSGSVQALYGDNADEPGWVFSVTPMYPGQLGAFCDYISANWDDFGIEGEPTLGHVSFIGALGESSDTPEARAYCESVGVTTAAARYFFPGIPNIATQVQQVVDEGANILYTTSAANGPAQVAATAQEMGLRDQVVIAGPNVVLDSSTVTLGGQNVDGMIGQLPYLWWDEIEHPGIQQVTDYWLENRFAENPESALELRNLAYLIAWTAVDLYVRLSIETVNRVGFENYDSLALYDTMTSGQRYEGLGGVIFVEYTETVRAPQETRLGSIQIDDDGAQILPITDRVPVPDLIPGGADVPAEGVE